MVDMTTFVPTIDELEARIIQLGTDIHTAIDDIVQHVEIHTTTETISVINGNHYQFSVKLRKLERLFKWYKDLTGEDRANELISVFMADYGNSKKECFVLNRVSTSN